MEATPQSYPAQLAIDYPDHSLNRLTSFFRVFTIIPIGIILCFLVGSDFHWGTAAWRMGFASGAVLFFPVLLMVLFRQKYPRWWFNWNVELTRFILRVASYFLLMSDKYPSTDEEQWVHVEITYPDAKNGINRWMPLVKWFLAIPHFICLAGLAIAAFVLEVIAWFAILFTGRFPRSFFDFVTGVLRWSLRVEAYAFLLTTDKYPPFNLE